MYKLLLATDRPEVLEAFNAFTAWESMGFRAPRIVTSVNAALKSLKEHHADAIAFSFGEQDEAMLMEHLRTFYPLLPIFTAAQNPGALTAVLQELRLLLSRMNSDFSNDDFSAADMLQICRHELFRALLEGRVTGEESLRRCLRLLRSRIDPDKPCVLAELSMPADSDFLKGRWHYGTERLEVALRNFFGVELAGMRMLVCVLPDERIFLLAGGMVGAQTADSMTGVVSRHAQECIEHVSEYLHLDLTITNIRVMPRLAELARKEERNSGNGNF
ncbi:MAG: hypothetical protein J1E43_11735 [Christensenellaceae bacterium]|nr:hypothetical protein [Christensenellaceae bacterium]